MSAAKVASTNNFEKGLRSRVTAAEGEASRLRAKLRATESELFRLSEKARVATYHGERLLYDDCIPCGPRDPGTKPESCAARGKCQCVLIYEAAVFLRELGGIASEAPATFTPEPKA